MMNLLSRLFGGAAPTIYEARASDPAAIAAHFLATLWGGLLVQLLLGVREAPSEKEIKARAHAAAQAILTLYAPARTGD